MCVPMPPKEFQSESYVTSYTSYIRYMYPTSLICCDIVPSNVLIPIRTVVTSYLNQWLLYEILDAPVLVTASGFSDSKSIQFARIHPILEPNILQLLHARKMTYQLQQCSHLKNSAYQARNVYYRSVLPLL
jgi:hypothetical protein